MPDLQRKGGGDRNAPIVPGNVLKRAHLWGLSRQGRSSRRKMQDLRRTRYSQKARRDRDRDPAGNSKRRDDPDVGKGRSGRAWDWRRSLYSNSREAALRLSSRRKQSG